MKRQDKTSAKHTHTKHIVHGIEQFIETLLAHQQNFHWNPLQTRAISKLQIAAKKCLLEGSSFLSTNWQVGVLSVHVKLCRLNRIFMVLLFD